MSALQIAALFLSCAAVALLILGSAWVAVHLRMLNGLSGEDWY